MLTVKAVCHAIHELKLRAQLEERQIEVTAHSYLQEHIATLKLYIVIVFAGEIKHRIDTHHHIRTMVVETRSSKNEVTSG